MNEYIKDYINTLNKSVLKKVNYVSFTTTNEENQTISIVYGDLKLNNNNLITKEATRCDYFNYTNSTSWECYSFKNQNILINKKELIYTNVSKNYPDVLSYNNNINNYLIVIIILISILLLLRSIGRVFK